MTLWKVFEWFDNDDKLFETKKKKITKNSKEKHIKYINSIQCDSGPVGHIMDILFMVY